MRRAADLVLREEGLERGGVDVAGTVGVCVCVSTWSVAGCLK